MVRDEDVGGGNMSVYCGAIDCVHNSNTNRCTAKKVVLSSHSVMTVWEGRQEFWRCKQYEMSEEARRVLAELDALMEQQI